MAYIGLARPYMAKLNEIDSTYSDGFRCGSAMKIDIDPQYNKAQLPGDNTIQESVTEFKLANVTLNTTHIPIEAAATVFGHEVVETEKGKRVIYRASDRQNYIGMGIYVDEMKEGVTTYSAMWMPKVKFSESTESYETKGDNLTFKTPSISGEALVTKDKIWKIVESFETEAEAILWLEEKAGIKAQSPAVLASKASVEKG